MVEYTRVFGFLNKIIQEKKINLLIFREFCDTLKIPEDIKNFAEDIIIKKSNIDNKKNCRKAFYLYISALFVSYIIKIGSYADLKNEMKSIIGENHYFSNVTKVINLNRIFSTILVGNRIYQYFHLVSDCLTKEETCIYLKNLYKIQIKNLFLEINKNNDIKRFFFNEEEISNFLKPVSFIINECFPERCENFDRYVYSAAFYFFVCTQRRRKLLKINKFRLSIILGLDRAVFNQYLDSIKRKINYNLITEKFSQKRFTSIKYYFKKEFTQNTTKNINTYQTINNAVAYES